MSESEIKRLIDACVYVADLLKQQVGSTGETVAERLAGIGGLYAQRLLDEALAAADLKGAAHGR